MRTGCRLNTTGLGKRNADQKKKKECIASCHGFPKHSRRCPCPVYSRAQLNKGLFIGQLGLGHAFLATITLRFRGLHYNLAVAVVCVWMTAGLSSLTRPALIGLGTGCPGSDCRLHYTLRESSPRWQHGARPMRPNPQTCTINRCSM